MRWIFVTTNLKESMAEPDHFTQLYVQIVFAVKKRKALIHHRWEEELFRYISRTVEEQGHKMIRINGMPDHIHILIGLTPTQSLSELIREVKRSSTDMIRSRAFTRAAFKWQKGYAAFSYSHSHLDRIIRYIEKQKEHHRKWGFREELKGFLKNFEIPYREKFLPHPPQ